MLIEFHILKNYPPVNLNRDDSGAPKTCFFGGVQRGRISSQCLKRSWRRSEAFEALGSRGVRTRHMPDLVAEKLRAEGVEEAYIEIAKGKLTGVANKDNKENKKGAYTSQIVFYAPEDIQRLAEALKEQIVQAGSVKKFEKAEVKDLVKPITKDAQSRAITADIALFGRMVTSDCFRDVDAAMQVAHAISTHAVNRESDYFTAVDDLLQDRDELGAGMMGDIDYNSCCYYEYASLDVDQLRTNLDGVQNADRLIRDLIPALAKAMAFTNPSGKQNTFAGQVLPSLILVECKQDKIPLSYVNAYEEPVSIYGRKSNIVEKSIEKLFDEINAMDAAYGLELRHRIWMAPKTQLNSLQKGERVASFDMLCAQINQWMEEQA